MKPGFRILEPQSPQEFEAYYLTRYQTLRAPWGKEPGSEMDEQEHLSVHAMAIDDAGVVIGVCRLQFNSDKEAQLRFMGVTEAARGTGIGKALIDHLENYAIQRGAQTMVLQARENAVDFYRKCGYEVVEKSFLMWDLIQHFLMRKKLIN